MTDVIGISLPLGWDKSYPLQSGCGTAEGGGGGLGSRGRVSVSRNGAGRNGVVRSRWG